MGQQPRWIVAGDSPATALIETSVREHDASLEVIRTGGFLAALGELSVHRADVVIGPLEAMRDMVASTAASLREMAPEARLVVIADEAQADEAEAALEAGFDAWLHRPVTSHTLQAALDMADGPTPAQQQEVDSPPPAVSADAELPGDIPAAGPSISTGPSGATAPASSLSDAPWSQAAEAEGPGGDLGDVDLIKSILADAGLREMAMRIVQGRSNIHEIRWSSSDDDIPDDHARAAVALGTRQFGLLHAPLPAAKSDLAGWAGWLAHWVALDEHVVTLKDMSMRDALSGMWNRRYFDRFLKRILDWAGRARSQVTLLVFDIDDFKVYNDRYGHTAGDEVLRETSRLMQSVVREHDVVARIGGDEFAVIFWEADAPRRPNSQHPENVVAAARRFRQAILNHRFPKLLDDAPGTLTISGGLASFPWDGRSPDELFNLADAMAFRSKRQGKNVITFGPGAEQLCGVRADDSEKEPHKPVPDKPQAKQGSGQ